MFMTTRRKRLSGFNERARIGPVVLTCILASAALERADAGQAQQTPTGGQQVAEARSETTALTLEDQELLFRLSQQFEEALELFEDPQRQSQSIDFFTQIVDAVDDERRTRDEVPDEIVALQQRALEHRARAFFTAGQTQGATDDFRQLLLDNPRYALDAEALSPRLVDFFEDLKKQLIGFIAVTTEPAGARVMVNGNFIGITNFFPVEVHTGIARVEVTLEGHESYIDEEMRIAPGDITTLDLVLTRTSARLPIITDPAGVEIVVDGEVVGVTSGTLPPDLRSFMPATMDPNRLSAPFELGALPLGQHQIELRLDCYQSVSFPFSADEPRDYTAQIVKLEESIGSLTITSNPSEASVYIDGELRGTTPLDLNRVCSGPHHLEVKHVTGKYVEDIDVGPDESLSFECPIRPTLAVLGVVAEQDVPARDLADIRQKLRAELPNLERMNLVFADEDFVRSQMGGVGLGAFVPSRSDAGVSTEQVRDLSEKLGQALEVEALLVVYVPSQRLIKDLVLHFLAVGSTTPDSYPVNYLDPQSLPSFLDELSAPTRLHGSWAGLLAVDTRTNPGPVVLAVDAGGPADASGVRPGDIVVTADGDPVTRALDLLEAVRAAEPGSSVALTVTRGGSSTSLSLDVGATPLEVPLGDPSFLYNKAIVDLRHRMVTEPENEQLARLNVGLCHMELGDYETALKEYLPRVVLPETGGISQGTVLYYTALAYLKLGERAEAVRLFQQALDFPEATLQSNEGPKVAPLAQRRLRELGQ
jgi:tetratricopeptide (TPR) repeat protein